MHAFGDSRDGRSFRVLTTPNEVGDLSTARFPDKWQPPEEWQDSAFGGLDRSKLYSTAQDFQLQGKSLFGGGDNTLCIRSSKDATIFFYGGHSITVNERSVHARNHMLYVDTIACVEHLLALRAALGLELEIHVDRPNVPLFHGLMQPVLEKLRENLREVGQRTFLAVRQPVAIHFSNGAYLMMEPPDDGCDLIIDHQIDHRGAVGVHRAEFRVRPEIAAYLLSARTMAYGWRALALLSIDSLNMYEALGLGFRADDILTVRGDRFLNPAPEFNDGGLNREAIAHGVVDKLGAAGALVPNLCGRLVTNRTSHAQDVEALRYLLEADLLTEWKA